jgi:hypothetical protein
MRFRKIAAIPAPATAFAVTSGLSHGVNSRTHFIVKELYKIYKLSGDEQNSSIQKVNKLFQQHHAACMYACKLNIYILLLSEI